ncbi:hypothetical protein ACFQZ4_16955 [Catellatospora coxensis]
MPGALAELGAPDESLREAVLGRVVDLATTIDVNRSPKATAKEQRELVGLLRVLGDATDPSAVGVLARHLAQMTWPARLWVAEFLAEAGRGNPEVIEAIGAMANGEVIYLRLLWLAGATTPRCGPRSRSPRAGTCWPRSPRPRCSATPTPTWRPGCARSATATPTSRTGSRPRARCGS